MRIDKVLWINLDMIKDIQKDLEDSKDYKKDFTSKAVVVLNHVSLVLTISEVTMLEYFFLRRYCTETSLNESWYVSKNAICKTTEPDKFEPALLE